MEPEVKGFVIISLPPPDDPSQGKTITAAFTLSNPSPSPQPQQQEPQHQPHHHNRPNALRVQSPLAPAPRSLIVTKKALAVLIGCTLLVSSLWACLFGEAPLQLLEESEEGKREAKSFFLPLYSKSGPNRTSLVEVGDVKLAGSVKIGGLVGTSKSVATSASFVTSVNSPVVVPLKGNIFPDGQYYTSIFIGNPPRPYFLDVDTGSDLTWIQCDAPCKRCAKGPHPLYKPVKAKIVQPRDSLCLEVQTNQGNGYCETCRQCDYEIEYADHSSSMGVLARDEMLIRANGDSVKLDFVFGYFKVNLYNYGTKMFSYFMSFHVFMYSCAYDQQGQLLASPAKTDGILGLSSAKVGLPSQLASQGLINNVVGHCIASEADRGGFLFFGEDFVPRWGVTWVSTISTPMNFYCTEFLKLGYGGQQISIGEQGGQVVFDTGSTYTYFTSGAYENLVTALESVSNDLVRDDSDQTLPVCWRADFPIRSVKDVKQFFEPLTIRFGKKWLIVPTSLTIHPEGYLIISKKGNVCLGILNGSEVYDGSMLILGDISLRGKLVVYDNVQQKIGWAESDCAIPQRRAKDFPFFL